MTADLAGAIAEGIWLNGRYVSPSEYMVCLRCGIARQTRGDRNTTLCMDCRTQQRADDDAWIRFHPRQPLSDEDMAWCLAQETAFNERRPVIYYRTKTTEAAA